MSHQILNNPDIDLIVILGATATGKTELSARLAKITGSEIISADSRQVYRGMDLGTGKDYEDYTIDGQKIPYHLIDIADPGDKYNVFEYQKDFLSVYQDIKNKGLTPILCGGTGMYIEAVLNGYRLLPVPPNPDRRLELGEMNIQALSDYLKSISKLHNTSDITNKKRLIRAIEIAEFSRDNSLKEDPFPSINPVVFGIKYDRESRRERITERLRKRLDTGMIDEVKKLLKTTSAEDLIYYGLEYKYLTLYCTGKINREELFAQLNTAIHQFAKRQMTWFRKMEKDGHKITWIDGNFSIDKKLEIILSKTSG